MAAFEPDLDTATYPSRMTADDVASQRRLVVNPLLAVVAMAGVWALFRYSLEVRNLALFASTLFAAFVCTLLVQFHCLDCGQSGFVLRSRGHACPAIVQRIRAGENPPGFPPSIYTQMKLWLAAAVLGSLLFVIFSHA